MKNILLFFRILGFVFWGMLPKLIGASLFMAFLITMIRMMLDRDFLHEGLTFGDATLTGITWGPILILGIFFSGVLFATFKFGLKNISMP